MDTPPARGMTDWARDLCMNHLLDCLMLCIQCCCMEAKLRKKSILTAKFSKFKKSYTKFLFFSSRLKTYFFHATTPMYSGNDGRVRGFLSVNHFGRFFLFRLKFSILNFNGKLIKRKFDDDQKICHIIIVGDNNLCFIWMREYL